MAQTGKYDIRADIAKNRLYIVLQGFLTDEQMRAAADEVIRCADRLSAPFDVINDISNFKPSGPQGAEEIKRAQQYVAAKGVHRSVRVVSSESLAAMQLARTGKAAGYVAEAVSTLAEAEEALKK